MLRESLSRLIFTIHDYQWFGANIGMLIQQDGLGTVSPYSGHSENSDFSFSILYYGSYIRCQFKLPLLTWSKMNYLRFSEKI